MMFFKVLFLTAIGLAVLVSSAAIASPSSGHDLVPTPPGVYNMSGPDSAIAMDCDPSMDWHSYSTAQVWMGKNPVVLGSLVDMALYSRISFILHQACSPGIFQDGYRECNETPWTFSTPCLQKGTGAIVECGLQISPRGRWHSEATRRNLIIAAAGALQAWTSVDVNENSNCRNVEPIGKMCVVGDVVRVNFPLVPYFWPGWNYLHLYFHMDRPDDSPTWDYDCCRGTGRAAMDTLFSHIDDDINAIYPWMGRKEWAHDSRCIIDGWKACPLSD